MKLIISAAAALTALSGVAFAQLSAEAEQFKMACEAARGEGPYCTCMAEKTDEDPAVLASIVSANGDPSQYSDAATAAVEECKASM